MLNHLDLHKILTSQHGFHNGFSCEPQLWMTLRDFIKYKDSRIQIHIIILDFSKAFDTLLHDKLLYRLRHYKGQFKE